MMRDFSDWPMVPETEPVRNIYVDGLLPDDVIKVLRKKRWNVVDIRLLPSSNMEERAEAVLAQLEGCRLGTIEPRGAQLKFLELEMRACGLHTGKRVQEEKAELDGETVETLLDFGKGR